MKYKFKFESLLKLRRHEQKKEQQKLGRLRKEKAALTSRMKAVNMQLENLGTSVSQKKIQQASDIRHQYALKHELGKKIWSMQDRKRKLSANVERQRERLREANQKTQMMEKLEYRDRAQFIKHKQHLEQLEQNEIATQRYNRLN